mmetsp:Transcript_26510/g.50376  ORF Transcript_26510/g.50376 Transcript_26510/m.50376 type:complete len:302 (-) Transcript_26510:361-1266(-)
MHTTCVRILVLHRFAPVVQEELQRCWEPPGPVRLIMRSPLLEPPIKVLLLPQPSLLQNVHAVKEIVAQQLVHVGPLLLAGPGVLARAHRQEHALGPGPGVAAHVLQEASARVPEGGRLHQHPPKHVRHVHGGVQGAYSPEGGAPEGASGGERADSVERLREGQHLAHHLVEVDVHAAPRPRRRLRTKVPHPGARRVRAVVQAAVATCVVDADDDERAHSSRLREVAGRDPGPPRHARETQVVLKQILAVVQVQHRQRRLPRISRRQPHSEDLFPSSGQMHLHSLQTAPHMLLSLHDLVLEQ